MAAASRDGYSMVGANTPRRRPSSFLFAAWWAATGMVAAFVALVAVVNLLAPPSSFMALLQLDRWYAPKGGHAGRTQALEKTVRTEKRMGGHPSTIPARH